MPRSMKLTMLMVDRNKRTVRGPTSNCGMTAPVQRRHERGGRPPPRSRESRRCRASSRTSTSSATPRTATALTPLRAGAARRRDAGLLRTLTLAVAFCAILIVAASCSVISEQNCVAARKGAAANRVRLYLPIRQEGFATLQVQRRLPRFGNAMPHCGWRGRRRVAGLHAPHLLRRRRRLVVADSEVVEGHRRVRARRPPRGACATFHYDVAAYYRHFAPRWSRPQSLCSASSAFRRRGSCCGSSRRSSIAGPSCSARCRLGFVHLYLAAGLASTVAGLMLRCGGTGAAGVLAHLTFHVCRQPSARHILA